MSTATALGQPGGLQPADRPAGGAGGARSRGCCACGCRARGCSSGRCCWWRACCCRWCGRWQQRGGRRQTSDATTAIADRGAARQPRRARLIRRAARSRCCCWRPGRCARLVWLASGFWRLRRYRRHSLPLEPASPWGAEADLRISDEIASPVTFGFLRSGGAAAARSSRNSTPPSRTPFCATKCCTSGGATGSSPSPKNWCARSSGSIPPSGGCWARSNWRASRRWTAR